MKVISYKDLPKPAAEATVSAVTRLHTPDSLLAEAHHAKAAMILPDTVSCFNDILQRRKNIAELALLPVKDDVTRAKYKNSNRAEMLAVIEGWLAETGFTSVLASNRYPYFLPPDVEQYLVWFGTHKFDRNTVCEHLAAYLEYLGVPPEQAIFYERPLGTNAPLVRGTFQEVRHAHLWIRRASTALAA